MLRTCKRMSPKVNRERTTLWTRQKAGKKVDEIGN